jgi:hypothetical protein
MFSIIIEKLVFLMTADIGNDIERYSLYARLIDKVISQTRHIGKRIGIKQDNKVAELVVSDMGMIFLFRKSLLCGCIFP